MRMRFKVLVLSRKSTDGMGGVSSLWMQMQKNWYLQI